MRLFCLQHECCNCVFCKRRSRDCGRHLYHVLLPYCRISADIRCCGCACVHSAEPLLLGCRFECDQKGIRPSFCHPCRVFCTSLSAAQVSTSVSLSPVLRICTSPAWVQPPHPARSLQEAASVQPLLREDVIDDECDCGVVEKGDLSHLSKSNARGGGGGGSSSSDDVASFSLVGNVMHTGLTMESGHYYADVRCDGRWVRVNDLNAEQILWDPRQEQNPSWTHMAYVQMYSCVADIEPTMAAVGINGTLDSQTRNGL